VSLNRISRKLHLRDSSIKMCAAKFM